MMNYQEAMDYVARIARFGSVLGLERIRTLLARLGNPQERLRVAHVAGTNGKGSVCTFLAAVLEQAGCRVGRYLSPAVYEYRERIQINGAYIPENSLCRLLQTVRDACEEIVRQGGEQPTVFEVETAVSFLYFAEERCDFVVLEVGLGGRFDSTNVIPHPAVSVITSISLDHMKILGDTLEKIAFEKAGILKEGRPAVLYQQAENVMQVLRTEARRRHVPVTETDFSQLEPLENNLNGQRFHYGALRGLHIRLLGAHQLKNAATAIEAARVLAKEGVPIDEGAIRRGLERAQWHGRFEKIGSYPTVMADGAHNPDAARRLRDAVETYFPHRHVTLVMGVFADKDYRQMTDILRPLSDTIIAFTPRAARGLDAAVLAETCRGRYHHALDGKTAAGALHLACSLTPSDGVVVCCGSLSTIGELTRLCAEREAGR